jgi:hippurate hydrolase
VINTEAAVTRSAEAAAAVVGRERVLTEFPPSLGREDFAFFTRACGGAYAWIGVGDVGPREGLHGDRYVFNDEIVPIGLRYWVTLVEQLLPISPGAHATHPENLAPA